MPETIADLLRTLTLVLAFASGGGVASLYWRRRSMMPWTAGAAYLVLVAFSIIVTIDNFNDGWEWGETPVAMASYLLALYTLRGYAAQRIARIHPHKE